MWYYRQTLRFDGQHIFPSTCGGSLPREGDGALLDEAREVGLACGGPSLRDGGILSKPFSLDEYDCTLRGDDGS